MTPRLLDLMDPDDRAIFDGRSLYVGNNGYAYISTWAGGPQTVHSLIIGPIPPKHHIDHINGNKLDNRRANLRVVTASVNQINRKNLNKNNSTGIRGVSYTPRLSPNKPWRAQITVARRNLHLGLFASKEEALLARKEAEATYYPEMCP